MSGSGIESSDVTSPRLPASRATARVTRAMRRRRDPDPHGPTAGAAPPTGVTLEPGTRIHQYELIKLIGKGGMGVVFLARDLRLGRRVAIKLLRTDHPERLQRVLAEARATARCQHENIVVIHEVGEHEGAPYLVLEYLRASST